MLLSDESMNQQQEQVKQVYNIGLAAASGDIYYVKECLQNGCTDLNKPYNGMTPLCLAAFWDNCDIVEFLLENGANVNAQSPQTLWTPCHCAAFQGHGKVLLKLLDYNPELQIKDKENRTAIDFASAIDTIWPFFAARGCKRTPKQELIAKKIIYKLSEQQASQSVYQSRPGSAYGIRDVSFDSSSGQSHRAYNGGDVLAIDEEESESILPSSAKGDSSAKNFNIWNLDM